MNIICVVLILISQLYCAKNKKVSVTGGFLCQGEIKNPPSKIENFTKQLVFGPENQYNNLSFHDFFFDYTQKDDMLIYNYIVIDDYNQWWFSELDNLLVYNDFDFIIDGVCTRMPCVSFDVDCKRTERICKRFYENIIFDIKCYFLIIINRYLLHYETVFRKLDDDYRAFVPQIEDQNCHENGKFSARQFILDRLNFFKSHDSCINVEDGELFEKFRKYFLRANIKILMGDTKKFTDTYSEEELRLYVQRCFDILQELSLFKQEENPIRYILPEKERTSILNKKVYIFKFNFQAILNNYEDKNPKKVEIKPEDLVFYNGSGMKVYIKHKDIVIFHHENPIYSCVAIDEKILRRLHARKFTCKKLFDEHIFIDKEEF